MKQQKSLFVTYLLWFLFGWFGLHHFYLGRDRHAFAWWSTFGGFFFLGWIRDFWRIPEYVDDANDEASYMVDLTQKMKIRKCPRFNVCRFAGEMVVGYLYGGFMRAALPEETFLSVEVVLICVGITAGVHLIGNIGREKGGFTIPFIATLSTYLFLFYHDKDNVSYMYCALASSCAFNYIREFRRTYEDRSLCKRIFLMGMCMCLFMTLWGCFFYFNAEITTEDGETIKIRDSINHFFKSPAWLEFKNTMWELYEEGRKHGWKNIYDELVKALDPKGEANARKVLSVSESASEQEIKRSYKQLVRKWHPDKNKGNTEEAEKKFMEIQEAYEILTSKRKSEPRTD